MDRYDPCGDLLETGVESQLETCFWCRRLVVISVLILVLLILLWRTCVLHFHNSS